MTYYFSKIVNLPFDDAVAATTEALKKNGFGVLTRIDVKDTLHKKLGVELRPYLILGACNPKMAYEALKLEDRIGTMLPCNVIVHDVGEGKIEIAAIDPVASMQAVDNQRLKDTAQQVAEMLRKVVRDL
jgi:uncharacterized protein (DUF302 family)